MISAMVIRFIQTRQSGRLEELDDYEPEEIVQVTNSVENVSSVSH